jgi:hypothetical protein
MATKSSIIKHLNKQSKNRFANDFAYITSSDVDKIVGRIQDKEIRKQHTEYLAKHILASEHKDAYLKEINYKSTKKTMAKKKKNINKMKKPLNSESKYLKLAKSKSLNENELNGLLRYINNKDDGSVYKAFNDNKAIYDRIGIKLSKEQVTKGFKWLKNLGFTPTGKERRNSPYGYREEYIVTNPKTILLAGFYDNAGFLQKRYLIPLYEAVGKDGTSMEYYGAGNSISIVG